MCICCNIERRLCNRCCNVKALKHCIFSISLSPSWPSPCVPSCPLCGYQHAKSMRHIVIFGMSGRTKFCPHKLHNFRVKVTGHNPPPHFYLKHLHVKYLLSDVNENLSSGGPRSMRAAMRKPMVAYSNFARALHHFTLLQLALIIRSLIKIGSLHRNSLHPTSVSPQYIK